MPHKEPYCFKTLYFPVANKHGEGIGKSLYSAFKRKDFCNDVNVIMVPVGGLSGLENPRNKLRW